MAHMQILALCVVFGGVCALYVTAVGFILSALVTVLILAGLNGFGEGLAGGWMLVGAFLALQGGYFLGIVGSALVSSVSSAIARRAREPRADLHIDHE